MVWVSPGVRGPHPAQPGPRPLLDQSTGNDRAANRSCLLGAWLDLKRARLPAKGFYVQRGSTALWWRAAAHHRAEQRRAHHPGAHAAGPLGHALSDRGRLAGRLHRLRLPAEPRASLPGHQLRVRQPRCCRLPRHLAGGRTDHPDRHRCHADHLEWRRTGEHWTRPEKSINMTILFSPGKSIIVPLFFSPSESDGQAAEQSSAAWPSLSLRGFWGGGWERKAFEN